MATEINWNDQTAEKLVKLLVEDFDASEHLASEAVARFAKENDGDPITEFDSLEALAEEIHDNQSYWED